MYQPVSTIIKGGVPMTKGEETRERVMRRATELVHRNGIRNTSVQDIIEKTGVKKGNLYFHFPSKDDLGISLIRKAWEEYADYMAKNVKSDDPLEKIDETLNAVLAYHRRNRFIGGCIFGNTALEMSDTDKRYSLLIQEIFGQWVKNLAGFIREAVKSGALSDKIKPDSLARHMVAAMEGGIMMARLYKREDPIADCIMYLKSLIGANEIQR
jgi:TetR/AcrR family transcriptional repressor of nem operon